MEPSVLLGVIILIVSILYKLFPPKNMNALYGYRTRKSMTNKDTWYEANRYAANLLLISSLVVIIPCLFFYFYMFNKILLNTTTVLLILLLILSVILTEKHLSKIFDNEGNRKNN